MGRVYFFASALSPAIIIASIRAFALIGSWAWVGISVGILSFAMTGVLLASRGRVSARVVEAVSVRDRTLQIPSYLITFVYPFLFLSESASSYTLLAYLVFGLLLGLLLIRTDIGLVNPTLLLFGYSLFEVETEFDILIVISKRRLMKNEPLKVHLISRNLYILAKRSEA